MPRLAPKPVNIDERERKELEKIVARHSTSQQVVKRGKIVLLASEGNNHRTIARELGISREMARLWRERWIELQRKDIPVRERLLSEASLKPHLSEYWLNPPPTKSLKKKSRTSVCYTSKQ